MDILSSFFRLMRRHLREPIAFAIVGIINTAVDFGLFILLVYLGMMPLLANAISFSVGGVNSYILNSRFTFLQENARPRSAATFLRFAIITVMSLGLSQGILWVGLQTGLLPVPAKGVSILSTFAFGFLANKLFVFSYKH